MYTAYVIVLISIFVYLGYLFYKEVSDSDSRRYKNKDVDFKYGIYKKYRGPEDEPEWESYQKHLPPRG